MKNARGSVRFFATIVLAAASAFSAAGQEALPFDQAMESLARSLAAAPEAAKPLRVAFLPFAAQGKAAKEDNGFGSFAADQLAIFAKRASSKLRVFERARLSDILSENELSLSGLIDADQAMQVGSLAPVDALVTGSYAADSSSITLSVRLVGVVTGEVLFSGTARSAIDGGAAAFFGPGSPKSDTAAVSAEDRVKAAIEEMKRLLADLSTDAKLEKAVLKAVGYPLFGDYSQLHILVCETLTHHGRLSARYRGFLLDSLSKAELVDGTGPTYALIDSGSYLEADGSIDDEEFAAGLTAASVMTATSYYNVVFSHIIGISAKTALPAQTVDARADAIMSRAKAGTMGRPAAISPGSCLDELLGALQRDGRAIARAYRAHSSGMKGSELDRAASTLRRAFQEEKAESVKRELLSLVAASYEARDFGENLARECWSFAWGLDSKEEDRPYAGEFVRLCPALMAKAVEAVPYGKEDRIHFCLRYGIDVPGLLPPMADLKRDIAFGETIQKKRDAAGMLIALGPKAAPAEEAVRQTLKFIRDKAIDGTGSPNLQMECFEILASIPKPNDESLAMIALGLDHSYSDVREAAAAAIEKIGAPALPHLGARISSGERAKRENVLRLLARMGTRASSLSGQLEKAAAAEKDEYMKGLMLEALSRMKARK